MLNRSRLGEDCMIIYKANSINTLNLANGIVEFQLILKSNIYARYY